MSYFHQPVSSAYCEIRCYLHCTDIPLIILFLLKEFLHTEEIYTVIPYVYQKMKTFFR